MKRKDGEAKCKHPHFDILAQAYSQMLEHRATTMVGFDMDGCGCAITVTIDRGHRSRSAGHSYTSDTPDEYAKNVQQWGRGDRKPRLQRTEGANGSE